MTKYSLKYFSKKKFMITFEFFLFFFPFIYCASNGNIQAWTFKKERVSKNAEIIIHSIKGSGDFNLMIQNKAQHDTLTISKYFLCNSSTPIYQCMSLNPINKSELPQSFLINPNMGAGYYYFTIYNCISPMKIQRITFSFLNSWGRLPFEKYPLIFICWIESAFYLVLLILCLINSLKHTELRVLLHYLIVGTVFIFTLSTIISGVLYTYTNRKSNKVNDINQNAIWITSSILLCLRNFCLLMLILFLVSGLSIIYEIIKVSKILLILLLSALFTVSEFLCDSDVLNDISFSIYAIIYVIFIVLYILYSIFLINLSCHSMNTLEAHLVMIQDANIDPETTPTYRKIELLEHLRKCSIAILLFFVGSSILRRMGIFYYFISYLIIEIAMAILLSLVCWFCRLRYKMAATYYDDEEAYVAKETQNDSQISEYSDENSRRLKTVFKYQVSNDHKNANQSQLENRADGQFNGQRNLQNQTENLVSVLTNQYDIDNDNKDGENDNRDGENDDRSLSSELSFEADADNQNQNQNENNANSQNGRSESSLIKWEYGMMLPPMPQEDFSQNQVHPTD